MIRIQKIQIWILIQKSDLKFEMFLFSFPGETQILYGNNAQQTGISVFRKDRKLFSNQKLVLF